jgi:hypothetical protein
MIAGVAQPHAELSSGAAVSTICPHCGAALPPGWTGEPQSVIKGEVEKSALFPTI